MGFWGCCPWMSTLMDAWRQCWRRSTPVQSTRFAWRPRGCLAPPTPKRYGGPNLIDNHSRASVWAVTVMGPGIVVPSGHARAAGDRLPTNQPTGSSAAAGGPVWGGALCTVDPQQVQSPTTVPGVRRHRGLWSRLRIDLPLGGGMLG